MGRTRRGLRVVKGIGIRAVWGIKGAGLAVGTAALLASTMPVAAGALSAGETRTGVPSRDAVVAAMDRAVGYYRSSFAVTTLPANGWSWSTYFQGVTALHATTGDASSLADALAWGRSTDWALTAPEPNPDSVKAAQVYHELRRLVGTTVRLGPSDTRMRAELQSLPRTQYDWADALFMGLPTWSRWAGRKGDSAYLDKMDALYTWARDDGLTSECAGKRRGLYDGTERLWYRDCRFIGSPDVNGKEVFWSRGNGWVLAAMAQVLTTTPDRGTRAAPYRIMLRAMAARLRQLQGSDGLWRSSLLDRPLYPQPESSGTALFTYALAVGVDAGVLDRATYLPVVTRAWTGLTSELQPSGFLSGCQPPGGRPAAPYSGSAPRTPAGSATAGTLHVDSPPFCVGAFLLAGSAVAKLTAIGTA